MTGFGRSTFSEDGWNLEVEIRTVNNRFLKVQTRLPERLAPFQADVEGLVREFVQRGSVYITVRADFPVETVASKVHFEALDQYKKLFEKIRKRYDLDGGPTVDTLLALPGVLEVNRDLPTPDRTIWKRLKQPTEAAVKGLIKMRTREGRGICRDIRERAAAIRALVERIEERRPAAVKASAKRLHDRVNQILRGKGPTVEASELAREVALLADKSDIAEEIQRAKSHLKEIGKVLRGDTGGRRLEFLVQELFREASTMAAKNTDSPMATMILDLRTEIDKIKEQAQNIE